jgi:hypothetical protein
MDSRFTSTWRALVAVAGVAGMGVMSLSGASARAQEGIPEPMMRLCSEVLRIGAVDDA